MMAMLWHASRGREKVRVFGTFRAPHGPWGQPPVPALEVQTRELSDPAGVSLAADRGAGEAAL